METDKERPNIRIEIQNEKMDVEESENEDGEIVDEEPGQVISVPKNSNRIVFTTGINIFDQEEQRKLQERAKRFALKPDEIHSFTDTDLEDLRESLGITEENENIVRFDTVHLLGTKDMLIEDILEYFAKYAPTEIEFVDEQSCNVKWIENISAARAMFYSSKAVNGMPVREQFHVKDFLENDMEEAPGQSILLKSRTVELKIDDVVPTTEKKFKNGIDISEINVPIPPGYWRMGDKHPKAKCLLLRFAFKTDKKPYGIETFAKYYKKLGMTKAQIDKRREPGGIFDRNKDLPKDKNPWGSLAKNWDQDVNLRETIPNSGEVVEIKNSSLATRLGVKEKVASDNEIEVVEAETTIKKPKGRSMRMRMYADEEEERIKNRKAIQKIKKQTEKLTTEPKDLRAILSMNNYSQPIEIIDLVQDDLGKKLKNRSRQMVVSIERDPWEIHHERKENIRSDIRSVLNKRRERSPIVERRPVRYRDRSPIRMYESPLRRRSPVNRRHRSPERTVRYNRYARYLHEGHGSDDDSRRTSKPKSKVAVVIKKQKKPTVASTIWSRVHESESEESSSGSEETSKSESEEESSSSSEESQSESESESSSSEETSVGIRRPGFEYNGMKMNPSRLKITMSNDRYKR
ncbi:nuclear cap-binding protein subunit 3-like [Diorhabda carinulata]|uniref:nuclear cap-binding protein subunit 3-like n=1 Tax=Diorhabda carinulata TaxID=1163345 RepID=UPI0025A03D0A|nr:nuclear cap-binding protein subunit 3-like [Diorhabda carinulata]